MTTPAVQEPGALLGQGRTADIYAWGERQVLKLYHVDWPTALIEQEVRISRQVAQTGLPVPAVGEMVTVEGRSGILFERVSGPTLVQHFMTKPWTVMTSVRLFTDLHLAMHAQVLPDLPAQRDAFRRQIAEADVAEPMRQAALRRLDALPEGQRLCHGDYHPENVLMTHAGPVIIDWMTATSGHPFADVARTALLLQMGELPHSPMSRWLLASARVVVHGAYLRRYLLRSPARVAEVAAWRLPVLVARLSDGIAEERDRLLRLVEQELSGSTSTSAG
jgi:aminoglycoside phosphotransferase (APT) family kinase protein